jgi:putative tricarboxylic transport membrane protein
MDLLTNLAHGFEVAFTWQNMGLALIGCFLGTIIGVLPGLGPSNGVALLLPLVFATGLQAAPALIMLASVYYGSMYGGAISSILINIPGDEPAVMTTIDGYPMAQQGRAGEALALSGISSFIGSFIATIGVALFSPLLVEMALLFGPAEYFALFTLAFAMLGLVSTANPWKSTLAAAIGLCVAMIGIDSATGAQRFTFGSIYLLDGINFLVAVVGLFAISEVLLFMEHKRSGPPASAKPDRITVPFATLRQCAGSIMRGTGIGFIAGVLPGAGASLGSFLAYTVEKRVSDRGTFGKGDPRGLAAPEAGNNAAAGGALIPMLSLGVPGSGTTAVLLAMLLTLNITPGPLLFQNNPDIVWGLIAALFIANVMLFLMNVPLVGIFVSMLRVPPRVLMPAIAMVSCIGIYGLSGSSFDLLMMIAFGVGGYFLRKLEVPLVPILLGVLLGGRMEDNLRQALTISDGNWSVLWRSPLCMLLWGLAILGFATPILIGRFLRPKAPVTAAAETPDPD